MLSPLHPVQLVLGLIVWSLWFVALYGGLSVACAFTPVAGATDPLNWLNGLLLLITLLVTALLLHWARRCWQACPPRGEGDQPVRFQTRVAAAVHLFSAGAALAVGLPVVALPPCV